MLLRLRRHKTLDISFAHVEESARISRIYFFRSRASGVFKEMMSDLDTFKIDFPKNSTEKQRALILGATFLLDINFFETDKTQQA